MSLCPKQNLRHPHWCVTEQLAGGKHVTREVCHRTHFLTRFLLMGIIFVFRRKLRFSKVQIFLSVSWRFRALCSTFPKNNERQERTIILFLPLCYCSVHDVPNARLWRQRLHYYNYFVNISFSLYRVRISSGLFIVFEFNYYTKVSLLLLLLLNAFIVMKCSGSGAQ